MSVPSESTSHDEPNPVPAFTSENAELFSTAFCKRVNELYFNRYRDHASPWTHQDLKDIYTEDVTWKFGDQKLNNLKEMQADWKEREMAWRARDTKKVELRSFKPSEVTFAEHVTFGTWDYKVLTVIFFWHLLVNDDGKVCHQEWTDPVQHVFGERTYIKNIQAYKDDNAKENMVEQPQGKILQ